MNGYTTQQGQPCCQQNAPYAPSSAAQGTADLYYPPMGDAQTQRAPTAQAPSSMQNVSPYLVPQSPPTMPAAQPGTTAAQYGASLAPITPLTQPAPITLESLQYFNGYLRTQIGRKVTVNFLIGTNTFIDKTGTLLGVGANYILLREIETDDVTMCDYYSIKFVRIYH
ncbi:MAG: hypothetical protein P4L75_02395 [Clostridia bacterium]|nr:hypothetical protein [Clostridia bacterium]MDR3645810.1 hypothetical protein [Clostridia bacterium]